MGYRVGWRCTLVKDGASWLPVTFSREDAPGGTSQGIAVIARDGRHRVILTSEIKNRDFPGQAWAFSDTKGRARLAWRGRSSGA